MVHQFFVDINSPQHFSLTKEGKNLLLDTIQWTWSYTEFKLTSPPADDAEDGIGICGWLLTALSWILVLTTLPFSLCVCFKVPLITFIVYKRGVIFLFF